MLKRLYEIKGHAVLSSKNRSYNCYVSHFPNGVVRFVVRTAPGDKLGNDYLLCIVDVMPSFSDEDALIAIFNEAKRQYASACIVEELIGKLRAIEIKNKNKGDCSGSREEDTNNV